MRTSILKKVSALVLIAMLVMASFAGLTFTTSAAKGGATAVAVADQTAALAAAEDVTVNDGFDTFLGKLTLWGFNGLTAANGIKLSTLIVDKAEAINDVSAFSGYNDAGDDVDWIFIDLSNEENLDNLGGVWVANGTKNLTLGSRGTTAWADIKGLEDLEAYTDDVLTVGTVYTVTLDGETFNLLIKGVDTKAEAIDTLDEVMAIDVANGNKALSSFLGYDATFKIGDKTYSYQKDKEVTYTAAKGFTLTLDAVPTGEVTVAVTGGAFGKNQSKDFALEGKNKTLDPKFYEGNKQVTVKMEVVKKDASTPLDWKGKTIEDKLASIKAYLAANNVTLYLGDKKLPNDDIKFSYEPADETNPMGWLVIDILNGALPSGLKLTVGALTGDTIQGVQKGFAGKFEATLGLYYETLVLPTADGYAFINVVINNSDQKTSPLTIDNIESLKNGGRNNYIFQVSMMDTRNDINKIIFVDFTASKSFQGLSAHWTTSGAPAKTAAEIQSIKDGKTDPFTKYVPNGVKGYNELVNHIDFLFYAADGSLYPQNGGRGASYTADLITAPADAAKNLWSTGGAATNRLNITLGGEMQTISFKRVHSGQVIALEVDNNDYYYTYYSINSKADFTMNAIGLGYTQKATANFTKLGNYYYNITAPGQNSNTTLDTAVGNYEGATKGYCFNGITVEEVNPVIALNTYVDATTSTIDGGDYNDLMTIFTLRLPLGTTFAIETSGKLEVTQLKAPSAVYGNNSSDGLVDYFFKVIYGSAENASFDLTYTFANKVYRTVTVNTSVTVKIAKDDKGDNKAYDDAVYKLGTTLALGEYDYADFEGRISPVEFPADPNAGSLTSDDENIISQYNPSEDTSSDDTTSSGDTTSSKPDMGNPFNGLAYIITIGATAIGGISTLIIRKRK